MSVKEKDVPRAMKQINYVRQLNEENIENLRKSEANVQAVPWQCKIHPYMINI